MHLFFTVVLFDDDGTMDKQVHGPFDTEEDRNSLIDEFEEDYGENAIICPINALVDEDDVNLLIGEE